MKMINILSTICQLKVTAKLILVILLAGLLGTLFYYMGGIELVFIFVLSLLVTSVVSLVMKFKKKKDKDLH